MADDSQSRHDSLTALVPVAGQHGGDGPAIAAALGLDPATILDLSQSMNPSAPSVQALVARHLDALGVYPSAIEATRLMAEALGVDPDRLLLTNGGSEAISLVAAEVGGQVHSEPEFALHPRNGTGPVWRSDPHNPTGRLADAGAQADVWDEAFYPLATGRWSAQRPGILLGSLTKVFDCPGLRIGYVIADDVERLSRRQPHWSVNSLALAILPELLESCDLPAWQTSIAAKRAAMVDLFEQRGFAVEQADAPWILVKAPGLREQLAPYGVIVRDCASFGLDGVVRLGVTHDEGIERLAAVLDQVIAFRSGSS
ncbi:MAG: aminotransferase class I/II-fold pyridoxal phosphate-dependent enzyme [Acidimicrobiales bacterium]